MCSRGPAGTVERQLRCVPLLQPPIKPPIRQRCRHVSFSAVVSGCRGEGGGHLRMRSFVPRPARWAGGVVNALRAPGCPHPSALLRMRGLAPRPPPDGGSSRGVSAAFANRRRVPCAAPDWPRRDPSAIKPGRPRGAFVSRRGRGRWRQR